MKNPLTKILFILFLSLTGIMIPMQKNSLKNQKDRPDWLLRARMASLIGTGVGMLIGTKLGKRGEGVKLINILKAGVGAMVGLGAGQAVIGAAGGSADTSSDAGTEAGEIADMILGGVVVVAAVMPKYKAIMAAVIPKYKAIMATLIGGGMGVVGVAVTRAGIGEKMGGMIGKAGNKVGAEARKQASKIYYRFAQRNQQR